MAEHPKLAAAKAALEDLIGDTSVSREETVEALDELGSIIETQSSVIKQELEDEEG